MTDDLIHALARLINWAEADVIWSNLARARDLTLPAARLIHPYVVPFDVPVGERTVQVTLNLRGTHVIHAIARMGQCHELIPGKFGRQDNLAIARAALPVMQNLIARVARLQ